MKLNKNKGKVHPSPSPSPASSSSSSSSSSSLFSLCSNSATTAADPTSSLNLLLPAAVLALTSALSLQDKEVLAYMITHFLKSSSNPAHFLDEKSTPQESKNNQGHNPRKPHKSPTFDCCCFDCYTTYWFRWDSSPQKELIHQAIEAFEEHLSASERSKKGGKGRKREKGKVVRHGSNNPVEKVGVAPERESVGIEERESQGREAGEVGPPEVGQSSPGNGSLDEIPVIEERQRTEEIETGEERESEVKEKKQALQQQQQHKGIARKVLPDVIGLFNSRLWSLWGTNV